MYHWWGWTVWLVTAATTTNDASIFHGENIVPPARYYVCVINNHLLLMTWKLLGSHGKQLRNAACTEPHQLKARLRVFVVVVLRRRRNYYILRKKVLFRPYRRLYCVFVCQLQTYFGAGWFGLQGWMLRPRKKGNELLEGSGVKSILNPPISMLWLKYPGVFSAKQRLKSGCLGPSLVIPKVKRMKFLIQEFLDQTQPKRVRLP